MENCNCELDNVIEANDIDAQRDYRGPQPPCVHDKCGRREVVAGTGGADSSLLFFFLLLVAIVCKCDIDIELDTLLWFFLLLVVIYQQYY